jgi:hypothetical protein|tara:strand:+ start:1539 stop:2093 length:555 start_codon:yes stop_codon:yes gene_type:complete
MRVEVDFEVLKQTKMSADDFIYLYIIYRKGFNYLKQLNLKPDVDRLQDDGYVKLGELPEDHTIRQEFLDLFISDFGQMFAELISTYPMKVNSPGRGVRILHAKDPDAKANEKCRNKYKKIVNDKPYKHKHIMRCLDTQLTLERDNLGFLQNLETWINNYTWEKYENLDENDTKQDTRPRITRSL